MIHEITDDYPPFEAIVRDKLGNPVEVKAEWLSFEEIRKYNDIAADKENGETGWDAVMKRAKMIFPNTDLSKFKIQTILKLINLYFDDLQKNPQEKPLEK